MYKKTNKRALGEEKEKLAADYLRSLGYDILETNYRTKYEEIDIIARDEGTIVFVEVKYRNSDKYGNPLEAVTFSKQRRISMGAVYYLSQNNISVDNSSIRFDAIGISKGEIKHIKDAFSYMGYR
ncbi:MAG: YraN family protein [Lachnospiraceae bacterium]|nr:YraN family protein [Lachnospiraceae bacterium]